MDKFTDDLSAITKGQKTIAEAMKELEVVKEAFLRSSRIESKILIHESEISEIKSRIEMLSTYSYVNSKNLEFQNYVENIVRSKIDELTFQMMFDLSKKLNESDAKKQLDAKVSWPDFISLKNNLNSVKLKQDTFLEIDFPATKAKINSKLEKIEGTLEQNSACMPQIEEIFKRLDSFQDKIDQLSKKPVSETFNKFVEMNVAQSLPERTPPKVIAKVTDDNQLYRKIEDLEKEIEDIFDDNTSTKTKFKYIEEVLKTLIKEIEKLSKECEKLFQNQKDIQQHFIQIIRNKDLQHNFRKDKIKIEKIAGNDLVKLNKELNEKNKKIVIMENNSKYLATEVEFLKKDLSDKIKEIHKHIGIIEKERIDFKDLKSNISIIETALSEKIAEDFSPHRSGFRYNDEEDKRIKRSYEIIKGFSDAFNKTLTPVVSKRSHPKITDKVLNFSPRITTKYK